MDNINILKKWRWLPLLLTFAGSTITQGADTQLTLIFDQNSSYEVRDARNKQLKKGNIEDDYHDAHSNKITRVIKVRIPSGISPFTVIVSHPDAVKFNYDGSEYQAPGKRFQVPGSERTRTPTIAPDEPAVSIKVRKSESARPKTIIGFGQQWRLWNRDEAPVGWPVARVSQSAENEWDRIEGPYEATIQREAPTKARESIDQFYLSFDQNSSFEVRDARNKQLKKGNIEDASLNLNGKTITRTRNVKIPSGILPFIVTVSHPDGVKVHYDSSEYQAPGKRFQVPESLLKPKSSGGTSSLYFQKAFEIEDPDAIAALQVESKFNEGILVYINGQEVASYNMEDYESHGDFAVSQDEPSAVFSTSVRGEDWQQRTWMGIDSRFLKPGTNSISAVLARSEHKQKSEFFFDLRLDYYSDVSFVKMPYLQSATTNSVVVAWEVSKPSKGSVEIKGMPSVFGQEEHTRHEVRLSGLQPGTRYEYRVVNQYGGQELAGDWGSFRTAPEKKQPFSFILYGDSRWGNKTHGKLADLMLREVQTDESVAFLLHTGDIVTHGHEWDLWQEKFFTPLTQLLQEVPIYPALGNHEGNQKHYYDYFVLPGNESWYNFRYGDAEFFALNNYAKFGPGSKQYKWFKKSLSESTARWKIVFFHEPPFSCTAKRKPGSRYVRKYLVPLFDSHGVDLVLLGHDHLYGRSRNINGVTYVISGGGGSGLYEGQEDGDMPVCIKKHHYVRFDVDNDSIRWKAIDSGGQFIPRSAGSVTARQR